jgi:phosphocarrier protein FPr
VVSNLAEAMGALDDAYFAGRSSDVLDIGQRLLVHLGATLGRAHLSSLPADTILIADELSPSDVVQLEPGNVLGIALAGGTPTAHSAILARSLGIPLVCGLGAGVLTVAPQSPCIVDGDRGLLVLEPDAVTLRRARASQQSLVEERAQAARHAHQPAHTRDGLHVPVLANANSPEDVFAAADVGAEGVGLLRTEYLFQQRSLPPTLEEQVETYGRFMRQLREHDAQPMQLTVRALDAGGDKPLRFFPHPPEENPFLGLRGVRLLIDEPEILRTQYRALQIAMHDHGSATWGAAGLEVRFMLPMVTTVEEVRFVRLLLANLHEGDMPRIKLGVMVEVPSAALITQQLTPYADFFSIGTNDLAQYTLASDRTHRTVGVLADPLHPAVLRLIEMTCRGARTARKPVSLCGEVAGDPSAARLLLGLGVQELSVPVPAVALVKAAVRRATLEECTVLAQEALTCPDAAAVRVLLQ